MFGAVRAIADTSRLAGVELVEMDVRSDTSVKEAFQQIVARAGRIDVLVNNAGATIVGAVEETSTTEASVLFDTNLFGILRTAQAVLPQMSARSMRPVLARLDLADNAMQRHAPGGRPFTIR